VTESQRECLSNINLAKPDANRDPAVPALPRSWSPPEAYTNAERKKISLTDSVFLKTKFPPPLPPPLPLLSLDLYGFENDSGITSLVVESFALLSSPDVLLRILPCW
jgi:hypothetical protein